MKYLDLFIYENANSLKEKNEKGPKVLDVIFDVDESISFSNHCVMVVVPKENGIGTTTKVITLDDSKFCILRYNHLREYQDTRKKLE